MDRIVSEPIKIDLHIHSCASWQKEHSSEVREALKCCTPQNVSVLVDKLVDNKIDAAAITDHDAFSFDMYDAFKKAAAGKLKKVFPGVEFTLCLNKDDGTDWPVHVIAIFEDSDDDGIKKIEKVLGNGGFKENQKGETYKQPKPYDKNNSYSQETLINILNEIGLDVVLIAHQKNTLTSKQGAKKNDLNGIGEEAFNKFLFSEFFQALEFHDKKNELFNCRSKSDYKDDILRFITGSDCHDWSVYPKHDKNIPDDNSFRFTFFKCLPTFRGLAMALTSESRISLSPSVFSASKERIDSLALSIGSKRYDIPMSKGLNAIIGDNSIGKSCILHKATNYYRKEKDKSTSAITPAIVKGYEAYLKKKDISILSKINKENIFLFDTQGEIRKKFAEGNLKSQDFIEKKAPAAPSVDKQKEDCKKAVDSYLEYLKGLNELTRVQKSFDESKIALGGVELSATVLKANNNLDDFKKELSGKKTSQTNFISKVEKVEGLLDEILLMVEEEEKETLTNFRPFLSTMKEKRLAKKNDFDSKIQVVTCISNAMNSYNDTETETTEDDQIIMQEKQELDSFVQTFVSYLEKKPEIGKPFELPSIGKFEIEPERLTYGDYKIVKKTKVTVFDNNYLHGLFENQLKKDCFNSDTFQETGKLSEALNKNKIVGMENDDPWEQYKQAVYKDVDDAFSIETKLNLVEDDDGEDKSSGFGQRMYFKVLASDDNSKGIYIIDQPEDDVSQKAIRDELISNLRKMARKRQVLLITHNPQFVVNLDVDNVISLVEGPEKSIHVHYGALEYQDDSGTDILKDVAELLDGGVLTIRKRWKRYEKNLDDIIG